MHTKAELHGQNQLVDVKPGMQKHADLEGQIRLMQTKLLVETKLLVRTRVLVQTKSKLERESGVQLLVQTKAELERESEAQVHVHGIALVREFQKMVFQRMV